MSKKPKTSKKLTLDKKSTQDKMLIGNLEICHLPELTIQGLQVRVDTGATTSSLHVDNIDMKDKKGKPWVSFDIHPSIHNVDKVTHCEAPLVDVRRIKSSNGKSQQRYVIETPITLGDQTWSIQITLTDRSDMSFLMLLGREAMGGRVLVDPSETFLLGGVDEDN